MAYPAYISNGGIGTGTDTSVAVPYPSNINANDVLFASIMDADNDTFDVPTGWGKIYEDGTNGSLSVAFYWKRADGTETGNVTFTSLLNSGSLVAGIIYRYSGCTTSGVPFEVMDGMAVVQAAGRTVTIIGGTLGTDRLALALNIVEDNTYTGFSGPGWSGDSALSTTVGSDAHFIALSSPISTSGDAPNNAIFSYSSSEYNGALELYLLPVPDAPVTLNSPSEAADIGNDLTPTLEFTADAPSNLDVEYQVRIGLTAGLEEKNIYYFDGSDVAAAGVGWTDVTNADDGDTGTFAFIGAVGDPPLTVFGTNAPASGGTISSIRGRLFGDASGALGGSVNVTFYKSDGTTYLSYVSKSFSQFSVAAWSSWSEFVTPIGTVTYAELQSMSIAVGGSAGTGDIQFYKAEIEVTSYEGDLFDSEVPDATFTNTVDPVTTSTYYFDGSDVGAVDTEAVWTDETNSDDGSITTFAYTTTGVGAPGTNDIVIEGTNAPASGVVVSQVSARAYWKVDTVSTAAWTDYFDLTVPTGGWTWAKIQALECNIWKDSGASDVSVNVEFWTDGQGESLGTLQEVEFLAFGSERLDVYKVEIAVSDSGDTHPFTDNVKVDYTVQGGSPLTYDTYYWTSRAKNPTGENIWDDWTFEIQATGTTYYMDGSISGATDADGAWTGATNLDDGDANTWASGTTDGNTSTNYIGISGTSCPSDNILPIDYVEARHSTWDNPLGYTAYVELNEPISGWTWDGLSKLESKTYYLVSTTANTTKIYTEGQTETLATITDAIAFSGIISIIELRVTTKDSYRAFTISSGSTANSNFFSFF
jgi:hypothetical protein